MLLTIACLNVLLAFQEIHKFRIVFFVTRQNQINIVSNTDFTRKSVRFSTRIPEIIQVSFDISQNRFWNVAKCMKVFSVVFSGIRIFWLVSRSKVEDFEQLSYYATLLALATICYSAFYTIDQHISEICYYETQCLGLNEHRVTGTYQKIHIDFFALEAKYFTHLQVSTGNICSKMQIL